MRVPRFLWVPFELGRPFGAPHEADFQRRVLGDALALLERTDGPSLVADFPDDAPHSNDEAVWACPISFGTAPDDTDLVAAIRAERAQLATWADLAPAPTPNADRTLDRSIELLERIADDGECDIETVRIAADDLRTWYLHAVSQQPGRATGGERAAWFWRETAMARLIGRVATKLVEHPDPMMRVFAERGLVPRDHWESATAER